MPVHNITRLECDLCAETSEKKLNEWCTLEVGCDQNGHPDRTAVVCPQCTGKIHGQFSRSMAAHGKQE